MSTSIIPAVTPPWRRSSIKDRKRSTPPFLVALALLVITAAAWYQLLFDDAAMSMRFSALSWRDATLFTAQWGVMMAAMMLPSATPMVLLYDTVRRRLAGRDRAIPTSLFVLVYIFVWLLTGIPIYLGYVAVSRMSAASPTFQTVVPYLVAFTILLAGLYQFSSLKRVCLRYCEAPLSFLMRRWHSGYRPTFIIALQHSIYCVGCCWALMLILVVAGMMSLPWVLAIACVVFAEKMLPHGQLTARLTGGVLIVLAVAAALKPELVGTLNGPGEQMEMDSMRH